MRVNADAMTLYAVTDRTWVKDTTLMDQVKEALEGGITFLQLREKHLSKEEFIKEAREMKELSKEYKVPFVINDNIEVALAVDADGVHIGQNDMSVEEARKLLGEDKIIGVSAHNVEEAIKSTKKAVQTIWELVQFVQHQPRKMPMLSLRKKLKKSVIQ